MRAFVSYRHKDWPFVHPMVERLQQYIYGSMFIDYRNIDEDNFAHSILTHLHQCDVVLLVITERTLAFERIRQPEDWIRREIATALQLNKRIIPILVDGISFPKPEALPLDLRPIVTKQAITFFQGYYDEGIQKLASFIGTITGTAGSPLLKRGQDALLIGDYMTAKSEIERALSTIQDSQQLHEAAQARFLLTLVRLNGRRPFVQTLPVMREVEHLLTLALTFYQSYTYLVTLALFKLDFARNGLPHLEQEANQLIARANATVQTSSDRENIQLLIRCQPDLCADYLTD